MKNGPQSPAGLNVVDFPSQLQHFVSREAEFSEQQADVGEVHAQEGVALWAGLGRPAHILGRNLKVSDHEAASLLRIYEANICSKVIIVGKSIKIHILHFFCPVHFILKDFGHSAGTQLVEVHCCLLSGKSVRYFSVFPLSFETGSQTGTDQLFSILHRLPFCATQNRQPSRHQSKPQVAVGIELVGPIENLQ